MYLSSISRQILGLGMRNTAQELYEKIGGLKFFYNCILYVIKIHQNCRF